MNSTIRKTTLWSISIAACVLVAIAVVRANESKPEPVFSEDSTPIVRESNVGLSYAPVVKKVRPSIVSVWTSKTVQVPQMSGFGGGNPFFDEPLFRRFFGDQGQSSTPNRQPQKQKRTGLGSGVIVTADGYILTNNHVVDDTDEVKVTLHDSNKEYDAKIVGTDPSSDLAILKIDASNLPAATLGDSDGVEEGDVVLAFGNPFGVGQTITMGIVSATHCNPNIDREENRMTYENFIQTDAAINPGNSGGALTDALGRVVGINTAIYSRTGGYQGIGWAIPVSTAKSVMKQIIKTGKVTRGYLGILLQPLTEELASEFKLKDQNGVLVASVTEGSASEKAGLKHGDVIIAVNGKKVEDSNTLRFQIADYPPGETVTLRIVRGGAEQDVNVTLDERPTSFDSEPGVIGSDENSNVLKGAKVRNLTEDVRKDLQIPEKVKGVLVSEVDVESDAAKNLRAGDIIQECNDREVKTIEDLKSALADKSRKTHKLLVYSRGITRFVILK